MLINEGRTDRALRAVAGLIGLYLGFTVSYWWYLLAVAGLGTAITGSCQLYRLCNWSTISTSKSISKPVSKKKK